MSNLSSPAQSPQSCHRRHSTTTRSRVREPHGLARLELRICGVRYRLKPNPPGSIAEIRSFRLRKDDGVCYVVTETLEGCTCTCPDYVKVRSVRGSSCKHIKAATVVGLFDGKDGAK
jgi:hypothetical protein